MFMEGELNRWRFCVIRRLKRVQIEAARCCRSEIRTNIWWNIRFLGDWMIWKWRMSITQICYQIETSFKPGSWGLNFLPWNCCARGVFCSREKLNWCKGLGCLREFNFRSDEIVKFHPFAVLSKLFGPWFHLTNKTGSKVEFKTFPHPTANTSLPNKIFISLFESFLTALFCS